jgi:hypothetical protein
VEGKTIEEVVDAFFGSSETSSEAVKSATAPQSLTFSWKLPGSGGWWMVRSLPLQLNQIVLAPPEAMGLVTGVPTFHSVFARPTVVPRLEVRGSSLLLFCVNMHSPSPNLPLFNLQMSIILGYGCIYDSTFLTVKSQNATFADGRPADWPPLLNALSRYSAKWLTALKFLVS